MSNPDNDRMTQFTQDALRTDLEMEARLTEDRIAQGTVVS